MLFYKASAISKNQCGVIQNRSHLRTHFFIGSSKDVVTAQTKDMKIEENGAIGTSLFHLEQNGEGWNNWTSIYENMKKG